MQKTTSQNITADVDRAKQSTDQLKVSDSLAVDVIASRLPDTKQNIHDIPSNVTYKSKADLALVRPHTFQEAVQDTEGAIFYDSVGSDWDKSFGMRGFSEGSAVAVLVDGVRVNEVDGDSVIYPLLNMQDVESIQIERGSASPIYGSNAFAGVVNITTGQPSPKPVHLFGGMEWTSFHGLRFYQGISGTLRDKWTPLDGKFKYYFKGGRDTGDGFRSNGGYRLTNFDLKTSYELPEEQGRLFFNWKHTEDLIKNPGEMTFQQFQDDPRRSNKLNDRRDFDNTIVQFGGEKKFWDDKLLFSMMTDWRWNMSHFVSTAVQMVNTPDTDQVTEKARATDLVWQLVYQETWRWIQSQALIGMEFRDARDHANELQATNGEVLPNTAPETDRNSTPGNVALFWRETLKFWEKVIIHYGMRHDFASLKTDDRVTPASNISKRWRDSTLSTGVTVKPLRFMDLFANYSQGFRVPMISEMNPYSSATNGFNANLQPETSSSYEVGTRLRYQDKASLRFSYFLIDMENEIVMDNSAVLLTAPWGANMNVGKSRRTGIEVGGDVSPIQEIKFYGTYALTRAWVREKNGASPYDDDLKDGRSLGQVPENRLTWGVHCWPLKRMGEPFDGLRVSLNGVYTGRQHPTSYESTPQADLDATGGAGHWIKAYTIWNFMLSYLWRGQEIYFKINNLFDEKYYSRAVDSQIYGTAVYPIGTYTFVNPGAPREFVIGTKWEFD